MHDGYSGSAARTPTANGPSQLLSNPNIIPDHQTGLSVAMNNGQIWSHNQPFNNGAMAPSPMAPTNSQFSTASGAYQSYDMDTDQAPTPPPQFNPAQNPNVQPPAYMSQTIQRSTTTTYGVPSYGPGASTPGGPPHGMVDVEMEHWIQQQQFPAHVTDTGYHSAHSSQSSSVYDAPVNTPINVSQTEVELAPMQQGSLPAAQPVLSLAQLSSMMELIVDDEEDIAKRAVAVMNDYSKNKVNEDIFIKGIGGILPNLMMSTRKFEASELLSDAAGCIYNFSRRRENFHALLTNNCIPFLVDCIRKPLALNSLQNYAVAALHTLITVAEPARAGRSAKQPDAERQADLNRQAAAKEEVIKFGGAEALVPLLSDTKSERKLLVCNCLKELALKNPTVKKTVVLCGGHFMLLRILDTFTDTSPPSEVKLLPHATEALKAVSSDEECKKAIIDFTYFSMVKEKEVDGIGVLIDCHNMTDKRVNASEKKSVPADILVILRNLSNVLARDRPTYNISSLAHLSIFLLQKRSQNNAVHPRALCAADILRNLTAVPYFREMVYYVGQNAVSLYLLNMLFDFPTHQGITESVVIALKFLTSKHKFSADIVNYIGSIERALELVVSILGQKGQWATLKEALRLITNLAANAANRVLLRNAGVLPSLLEMLFGAYSKIFTSEKSARENALMSTDNAGSSPVKAIDILWGTIGCLSELMDDHGVMEQVIQCVRDQGRSNNGLLAVLFQLLQYHFAQDGYRGQIRRVVTDLLGKLTVSAEGSSLVKSFAPEIFDALQNLSQLPQSSSANTAIVQSSNKSLYNMTADRSAGNFQQEQSQMMQQSAPSVSEFDGFGYTYHQYASSGPPSMHGSTFGSVMSVANSDILSDYEAPSQNLQNLAGPSRGRSYHEQAASQPGQEYPSSPYGAQPQQYQHRSGTSTPLQISTASRAYQPGSSRTQTTHQMQ